ncbi:MAG TPA: 30S ribosomal protein S15 [Campylobacterales bacterium]|nr:30S ribosomal protein S15 [Campylobacterales bacterium]
MALDTAKKAEIVKEFARGENDTGSPEVQVALISNRISYLTEHLKENKKDHSSRLGLLKLVGQRKRLLRYLKKRDYARYQEIIKTLNIRDNI